MRDKIILQQYKSGSMLTEVGISKEYNISRGSVRTALYALESEGLILTLENGRKRVEGITKKYVEDLYDIRKTLECEALQIVIAAHYLDYSPLFASVNMFQQSSSETAEVMKASRANANEKFHKSLVEIADNRPLLQCWNTIGPTIKALAKFNSDTLEAETHGADYVDSHVRLLDLIVQKNAQAKEALSKHIDFAKRDTFLGLKKIGCIL